ncbi:DUF4010 domain-containing protein [Candidatus Peregrinibacteria bacterium]|nr:DUF4010 domain-containing protein [Candidatus Peregrinibacteria bacterium]
MDLEVFKQLGIALILSSLIGLEREQKYQKFGFEAFGGIRTLPLVGLVGALSFILFQYSVWIFVVLTLSMMALLTVSYYMVNKKSDTVGGTTEVATMLVYIVGILCGMQKFLLATSIALTVLLILHFKDPLHKWAKRLKNKELISTIQFVVIAFVVLPLLPNQGYGPYGFFNPYIIWLMVVFISGISFVSYIAIKLFGAKRGIGLTGFLAGLISSTALSLSFSGQSKKNKSIENPYVLAIVVASSAMFFRILIEILVLNRELLGPVSIPMITMGVVGIFSALFFWFRKEKVPSKIEDKLLKVKSPFSLWPALKFGLFFAVVLFLVNAGKEFMGEKGIYLTSLLSGLADVDAITVSMANLAKEKVSTNVAVNSITIAAMTNTLVKGGIFLLFGNKKVAWKILLVFVLMLIAGGVSLIFI